MFCVWGNGSGSRGGSRSARRMKKVSNAASIALYMTDQLEKSDKLRKLKNEEEAAIKALPASLSLKDELEMELEDLRPVLRSASENTILPWPNIYAVKATKFDPPLAVKIVMECICILKGIPPWEKYNEKGEKIEADNYWIPSKKILNGNFVQELVDLKKNSIPLEYVRKFERRFAANPEWQNATNQDKIFSAFPAAEGLYIWIVAVLHYQFVLRLVKEKKRQQIKAERIYLQAKEALPGIRDQIARIERDKKNKKEDAFKPINIKG